MLVLTRKYGEKIVINNDICITIVQIKGKQVRIGIKAGEDTKIFRGEFVEQKILENINKKARRKIK